MNLEVVGVSLKVCGLVDVLNVGGRVVGMNLEVTVSMLLTVGGKVLKVGLGDVTRCVVCLIVVVVIHVEGILVLSVVIVFGFG